MIRGETKQRLFRPYRWAFAALVGALLVAAPAAFAHVERASYWPDKSVEMVDGVPAGGSVPEARSLFTALDETTAEQAHVVCQTGDAIVPPAPPVRRADQQVAPPRAGVEVSRELVNRLERKLRSLKRKLKDGKVDKDQIKRKVKRVKRRLAAALAVYNQAVADENVSRQQAEADYQRRLQEELAARDQADEDFAAAQAAYEEDLDEYEQDVDEDPSMEDLDAAIQDARDNGYVIRPSEGPRNFSGADATKLRDFNVRLLAECEYEEIQPAVNAADNNDRVVIMPGIYEEPTSRAVDESPAPVDNPCENMRELNDRGQPTALSYRYQFNCPNQQNLIAVMGREPKKNPDNTDFVPPNPSPTDPRRDGIPDEGPCIRCNLQMEGSGVSADDVVVDSGNVDSGNGPPMDSVKDVGIRADRADGFVLRNITARHAEEHDIYSPETDGLLLERFKTYFNGEYGVLTFVAENHLIQDCDAAGSGDAAIYPGSSGERGEQAADPDVDVDDPTLPHTGPGTGPADPAKYSTEIRRCDMRHSSTGYSGTAGNSVWLHHNDFYDNAMGFVTDVFTAAGHPGFPQDSDLVEDNQFYSNNFNPFIADGDGDLIVCDSEGGEIPYPGDTTPGGPEDPSSQVCTDVIPKIPAPVGTAIFLPGVNNNTIRNNRMWDNWRRGTMLFAVPDSFVCGNGPLAGGNNQHGCDETELNTAHRNEHYGNVMGRSPAGPAEPTWPDLAADTEDRNGLDFWWDSFAGNARNCWYDNDGPESDGSGLSSLPAAPLLPGETIPCAASLGTGGLLQEEELLDCLGNYEFGTPGACTWFATPPEPAST